jgi:DNA-directed RNA polymerase specialized sigma24 family protein
MNPDERWLSALRLRLLALARRRVAAGAEEDLVQETLRTLAQKGVVAADAVTPTGAPPLAFAFQTLRFTIGNHYQRQRVRGRVHAPLAAGVDHPDTAATPLEALTSAEAVRIIEEGLGWLTRQGGACGRYLQALLAGDAPRTLARAEGLDEAVLHRRVYRCREKLRAWLAARGILA